MDKPERQRLKTLANEGIIATYGYDNQTSQLAEALEQCIDWIDDIADKCEHCRNCEHHGDHADAPTVFTKI